VKHEIRNKFKYQNLNDQNKNGIKKNYWALVLDLKNLNFVFVSDFDIRISDLLVLF